MSSSDFMAISSGSPVFRAERLFRASISAFASLTRPSRAEAAQLEDLVLPLLPLMPAETLRFAAAALSHCHEAPGTLVRKLADKPTSISAPLLIRSRVLTDIDLVSLIGRHGLPHALAIARRPNLNRDLLDVIQALVGAGRSEETSVLPLAAEPEAGRLEPETPDTPSTTGTSRAEAVRADLRSMMVPAASTQRSAPGRHDVDWEIAAAGYPRLLSTAMTGHRPLFQTAMADLLDLDFGTACEIVDAVDGRTMVLALRAMDLSPEQAFTLFALCYPGGFSDLEAVRGFLDRFREIERKAARERLDALRRQSRPFARQVARRAPANDAAEASRALTA